MDFLQLIDQLEEMIANSARLPLTGKVMLDEQEVLDLVDRMRTSLPQDLKDAREVLQERERIIGQARLEARSISSAAEENLKTRLYGSDYVKAAESAAAKMLREAEENAQALVEESKKKADRLLAGLEDRLSAARADADQYALQVLRQLETQLTGFLATVQKGIEMLEMARKE